MAKSKRESIRKQFERVEILVDAIAKDRLAGLILCGAPGVGKTFLTRQTLVKAGVEFVETSVNNAPALVHCLWMDRDAPVFLLDDTDSLAGRRKSETANENPPLNYLIKAGRSSAPPAFFLSPITASKVVVLDPNCSARNNGLPRGTATATCTSEVSRAVPSAPQIATQSSGSVF